MKRVLLVLITLLALASSRATVVLDATDGQPIVAATIMNSEGHVLGLTDARGQVPVDYLSQLPLTIRTMGYESAAVTAESDTILLAPSVYELPDLEVSSADRNVVRLVFFVRQYTSLTGDTKQITQVSESMVDFFIPIRKAKKIDGTAELRVLFQRSASHTVWADGRDSLQCPATEDLSFLNSLVTIDSAQVPEPQSFALISHDSIACDTMWSKHIYPHQIFRRTPVGYFVTVDALAKQKNHRFSPWYFKLLGLTVDINELMATYVFAPTTRTLHRRDELTSMSHSLQIDCRGKWFKRAMDSDAPVDMRSWAEFYLVDRTYLPDTEARELMRDKEAEYPLTIPADVPPLAPIFQPLLPQPQ